MSFQMVVLVLNDTRAEAHKDLFMHIKILVQVAHLNGCRTNYILADAGQRETTFRIGAGLFRLLEYLGIDEGTLETLAPRVAL